MTSKFSAAKGDLEQAKIALEKARSVLRHLQAAEIGDLQVALAKAEYTRAKDACGVKRSEYENACRDLELARQEKRREYDDACRAYDAARQAYTGSRSASSVEVDAAKTAVLKARAVLADAKVAYEQEWIVYRKAMSGNRLPPQVGGSDDGDI